MKLLDTNGIEQKIKRLAIEILENNSSEKEIVLAGINNNGKAFAELILHAMQNIKVVSPWLILTSIRLNPASPIEHPITVDMPLEELKNKVIIVIDDVANTGRTLQFAMKPLLDILVKKIELAVLVNRKHKSYPVAPNYVGVELSTTLRDNITVEIYGIPKEKQAVYLS